MNDDKKYTLNSDVLKTLYKDTGYIGNNYFEIEHVEGRSEPYLYLEIGNWISPLTFEEWENIKTTIDAAIEKYNQTLRGNYG